MKSQSRFILNIAALVASFVFVSASNADVIQLRSDNSVRVLTGPLNSGFGGPFVGNDFAAASGGGNAFVVAPNAAWISSLPSDGLAQWISTASTSAAGGSGLFAINFNVANPFITASIDLRYAADNTVGDAQNAGFFLNGNAISAVGPNGNFTAENTFQNNNVAPFLNQGSNTLYVYLNDTGFDSGVIFSANVVTAVPEPSSLLLLSGLLVGGIGFKRFRLFKSRLAGTSNA